MQVLEDSKVKLVSVSLLLGSALCSFFGSVSGPFTTPDLIVSLWGGGRCIEERERRKKNKGGKKPPAHFKPPK